MEVYTICTNLKLNFSQGWIVFFSGLVYTQKTDGPASAEN